MHPRFVKIGADSFNLCLVSTVQRKELVTVVMANGAEWEFDDPEEIATLERALEKITWPI